MLRPSQMQQFPGIAFVNLLPGRVRKPQAVYGPDGLSYGKGAVCDVERHIRAEQQVILSEKFKAASKAGRASRSRGFAANLSRWL